MTPEQFEAFLAGLHGVEDISDVRPEAMNYWGAFFWQLAVYSKQVMDAWWILLEAYNKKHVWVPKDRSGLASPDGTLLGGTLLLGFEIPPMEGFSDDQP